MCKSHHLTLDIPILIHQDGWRVSLWVPFNAKICPHLTELDIPELDCRLSPQFRKNSGFHISAQRRGQIDQHKRLGTLLGDITCVVGLLKSINLPVDGLFGEFGEFREALFTVLFEEGFILFVFQGVELFEVLIFESVFVGALLGLNEGFLNDRFWVLRLLRDDAVFS